MKLVARHAAAVAACIAGSLMRLSLAHADERSLAAGVVLDDAGVPLVGAEVTLESEGAFAGRAAGAWVPAMTVGGARSDDRGRFEVEVHLPGYSIVRARASSGGHDSDETLLATTTNTGSAPATLVLHRLCADELRVQDASGNAVEDSVVFVTRDSAMEGAWDLGTGSVRLGTNADGVAAADGLRVGMKYWAYAWKRGVGVSRPVVFVPGAGLQPAGHVLKLGEFSALDVVAVYETGEVARDFAVLSTAMLESVEGSALTSGSATPLTGLRPGASVITIAARDAVTAERIVELVPGEMARERVVLTRAIPRAATLTDASGTPLAGRSIVVTSEDPDLLAGPLAYAEPTDSNGRFGIGPDAGARVLVAGTGSEVAGAWWGRARHVEPLRWVLGAPCVVDVPGDDAWVAVALDPITRLPRAEFERAPLRIERGTQLHRFGPVAFRRFDARGRLVEVVEEVVVPGGNLELRTREAGTRRLLADAFDSRGRPVPRFRARIVEVDGFGTPPYTEFPRVESVTLPGVPAGRCHVVFTAPGYVAQVVPVDATMQGVAAQLMRVGGLKISREIGTRCTVVEVELKDGGEPRLVQAARLEDDLSLVVAPGRYRVTSRRREERAEVRDVVVRESQLVSLVVGGKEK